MKKVKGQMSESLVLGLLLALAGGFFDAYTYLCRGGVFANAETGNIVLLGAHLAEGDLEKALRYLLPIVAFAFGVLSAELVKRRFKSRQNRDINIHWRQIVVLGEMVLVTIAALLPQRSAQSNKGSYGSVAAAAGSLAYRGAAALCVEGALRTGAGLVYLASVEPVIQLVLTRTPECCALPCRTDADGGILAADAAAVRQRFTEKPAVLLAGPGLGPSAARILNALLTADAKWKAAVLDADALNALAAGELGQFPLLPTNTVLTPHPGEAARLLGCSVAQIQTDRPAAAQELAERYGCVAVLKGSGTLIAAPGREMLHNPTGNPGLARGGSGDVLAGMLAALLAQGLAPFDAAACAVWLHGAAADRCAARTSQLTMLPHDILTDLADVVKELTGR